MSSTDEGESSRNKSRILLFTAFTDDYSPGFVCSPINEKYAKDKGYQWACHVLSRAEMDAETSGRPPTWSVALLQIAMN